MARLRPVEFGYHPPAGKRGIERFPAETFVRDLQNVLDVASQSFSSLWVSDHLMEAEPFQMDVWTTLTWIASRYPGPLLGTFVLSNSFRHPPLVAKMAASLQAFSHGRLVLGYGAGWHAPEFRAYGYEFPPTRVRIAQMVEGLQIMRAMWTSSPATFHGSHYHIDRAYCEPRPDPLPIVMIGGDGERHTRCARSPNTPTGGTRSCDLSQYCAINSRSSSSAVAMSDATRPVFARR